VSSFDIVQRHFDIPFYSGDITNVDEVSNALRKACPYCHRLPSALTVLRAAQLVLFTLLPHLQA
jgi:hypothetical protein